MLKDIIVLTCSKKYSEYCVSGIDAKTGKWIRLVTKDNDTEAAVPYRDIQYNDGATLKPLDVIKVDILEHKPLYYQPENYLYNQKFKWKYVNKVKLEYVTDLVKQNDDKLLFYNHHKTVEPDELKSIDEDQRYSLKIIPIENLVLHIEQAEKFAPRKYRLYFNYNGIEYKGWSITDLVLLGKFKEYTLGVYPSKRDAIAVISLTGPYEWDNKHYKIIAQLF